MAKLMGEQADLIAYTPTDVERLAQRVVVTRHELTEAARDLKEAQQGHKDAKGAHEKAVAQFVTARDSVRRAGGVLAVDDDEPEDEDA